MRLTEDDIELMYQINISEQIVAILKVPSEPFYEKEKDVMGSGRLSAGQKSSRLRKNALESEEKTAKKIPPSDYLFVLTSNFKCILYKHSI
jgi:hypothetical protein